MIPCRLSVYPHSIRYLRLNAENIRWRENNLYIHPRGCWGVGRKIRKKRPAKRCTNAEKAGDANTKRKVFGQLLARSLHHDVRRRRLSTLSPPDVRGEVKRVERPTVSTTETKKGGVTCPISPRAAMMRPGCSSSQPASPSFIWRFPATVQKRER